MLKNHYEWVQIKDRERDFERQKKAQDAMNKMPPTKGKK